jgi:hypothetical protein
MSNELYNLHVSLKSLTKENARIKNTNDLLIDRNNFLEQELLVQERCKKECKDAREELVNSLQRELSLKETLEKEKLLIKKWNASGEKVRVQVENKIEETFLNPKKSAGKKPVVEEQSTDNLESTDNSDTEYLSIDNKFKKHNHC